MLVPFEQIPPQSKLWVYASPVAFTEQQEYDITTVLSLFIEQWEAHGAPLKGGFKTINSHFILIAVDESFNGASGCSIDKSVQAVKNIESKTGLRLFDRLTVYAEDGRDGFRIIPPAEIKQAIDAGFLTPETKIAQTSIQSMEEYAQKWMVEAKSTYLRRYFASVLG